MLYCSSSLSCMINTLSIMFEVCEVQIIIVCLHIVLCDYIDMEHAYFGLEEVYIV